jgi:hypothetical protein
MQARLDGAGRDGQGDRDLGLVQLLPRVQQQYVAFVGCQGGKRSGDCRTGDRAVGASGYPLGKRSAAASTPVRA